MKTIASGTPHMEVQKIDGKMTISICTMNKKKSLKRSKNKGKENSIK